MGFSGHLVFARSERPLLQAPAFDGLDQELTSSVNAWEARPGGWQTLQLRQGLWEEGRLPALVEWSGSPACVADVSDSSLALVTGLSADGGQWQAWLNLDHVAALLLEAPDDVDDMSLWYGTPECEEAVRRKRAELETDVPADAQACLAWASAAGFGTRARRPRIEELLCSHATFVEDLFDTLLDELGFPRAPGL